MSAVLGFINLAAGLGMRIFTHEAGGGCTSVCVELQKFSAIRYSMETERTLNSDYAELVASLMSAVGGLTQLTHSA